MQNPRLNDQMRKLGASGPSALPPDHLFIYVAEFTTAIAAAGNSTAQVRIDAGAHFIVDDIVAGFQLSAAYLTAIAGTPLALESNCVGATSTAATSNNMPTLDHLRISFSSTDRPWQNVPMRLGTALGNARTRAYLAWKAAIAGNDSLLVTVYNDSPTTVVGQVHLIGHKMPYQTAA